MNTDNLKGAAKKAEGSVESGVGGFANNRSMQAKGEANKLAGSVQNAFGDAEDKIVSLADKARGFIDDAGDNLTQAKERVNSEIHERPVRSALIALGVGYLLGRLFT